MSRPRYESQKDIDEEQAFCKKIQNRKNVELCKLSEVKYVIDFAVYDKQNNVKGFIEFRRRYNKSTKYKTVFCSLTKWMKLKDFSRYHWTAFFVQFDDHLMYLCPNEKPYKVTISGRKDRNDQYDEEPNILLPVEDFHKW